MLFKFAVNSRLLIHKTMNLKGLPGLFGWWDSKKAGMYPAGRLFVEHQFQRASVCGMFAEQHLRNVILNFRMAVSRLDGAW